MTGSSPKVVNRRERALVAYVDDDMTLEQIGQRWGVTREMIRQDLNKHDRTVFALAKRRRRARTRLQAFVRDGRVVGFSPCIVCGEPFERRSSRDKYCSPTHYQVRLLLRNALDGDWHGRHKQHVAKWNLRNGGEIAVRHAMRVLAGEADSRGRWLTVGSLAFHWAVRAHALRWPLFDELCAEVQAQVREFCESAA